MAYGGRQVPIGGRYSSSNPTPATNGDEVVIRVNEFGELIIANSTGWSGASSAIGGGNSVYSNTQGDFTATANNGTKTITFSSYASSVLSAVIANINFLNAVIKRRTTVGVVDTLPLTSVSFSANVLTLTDMTGNFAATDTVAVFVQGPDKSFNAVLNALRTELINKIYGEDETNDVLGAIMKPVVSGAYSPGNYKNAGSVTKANVIAVPGNIYSLRVTNDNAAERYFQLHNKATAPAAADTALRYWKIPAGTAANPGILHLTSDYLAPSVYFSTGIGWAISTTAAAFTDSATASEHNVDLNYV